MTPGTTNEPATVHWRDVDWPRVARATYEVRQHYRYTYTGPITDLKQRLVMVPPEAYGDQRVTWHRLEVRGTGADGSTQTWEVDADGNRVCRVTAARVAHAVDFEARYQAVRAVPDPRTVDQKAPTLGLPGRYLRPTALTAPDERLRAAAREIEAAADTPLARAEQANQWAAGAILYQFGVTGVQTPASMALHLGKGVCQDYAHILLSVLRLMGIPARYVSGQLLGEGAPHAWVEAFVPGEPWPIHYDPTHRRRAGMSYITVAVGRDFADVTPTSGFFSGGAHGKLSASKEALVVEVQYADGTRLPNAERAEEDRAA